MNEARIEAGKMTMRAPVHRVEEKREKSGCSVTFGAGSMLAAAFLGANPFIAALPLVSVSEERASSRSDTVQHTTLNANNLFVNVGNAVYSGAEIKANVLKAAVRGNITIETMTDLFRAESHRTDVGMSLGAFFGALTNVPPPGAFMGGATALSGLPSMWFASEKVISERFDRVAQVIGLQEFYMKVGGLLHTRSAEIGLRPDGYITSSEAEHIEAGRRLNEEVHTEHSEEHVVFNPCLAELLTLKSQVNEFKKVQSEFMTQRLAEGASMKEAREESKALESVFESEAVKEPYTKLKQTNSELQKAAEKIEKIDNAAKARAESAVANVTRPTMGEFVLTAYEIAQRETAVREYNAIARTSLLYLTKVREGIQDWTGAHPTMAKVGEYAMDAVGYTVLVTSTIALASSFTATATVSVPMAVGGLAMYSGIEMGKHHLVKFGREQLVEFARTQGVNALESLRFADTANWLVDKARNVVDICKFSKAIKKPTKHYTDAKQAYEISRELSKYGMIAMALNKDINIYSKNKKAELLYDVLSKLGE